jgi:hypothetical protein
MQRFKYTHIRPVLNCGSRGEVGCEYVDRIHLAQDREKWQVLMNTVTKLQVPLKVGHSLRS